MFQNLYAIWHHNILGAWNGRRQVYSLLAYFRNEIFGQRSYKYIPSQQKSFRIIWERPNSTLNTFTFHGQSAFYNLWDGKFLSLKTSLNVVSRM